MADRRRDERGNYLALLLGGILLFSIIVATMAMCSTGNTLDEYNGCYSVGQPGSAQYQRDLEECIREGHN